MSLDFRIESGLGLLSCTDQWSSPITAKVTQIGLALLAKSSLSKPTQYLVTARGPERHNLVEAMEPRHYATISPPSIHFYISNTLPLLSALVCILSKMNEKTIGDIIRGLPDIGEGIHTTRYIINPKNMCSFKYRKKDSVRPHGMPCQPNPYNN